MPGRAGAGGAGSEQKMERPNSGVKISQTRERKTAKLRNENQPNSGIGGDRSEMQDFLS